MNCEQRHLNSNEINKKLESLINEFKESNSELKLKEISI